jgi:hypothetical protein
MTTRPPSSAATCTSLVYSKDCAELQQHQGESEEADHLRATYWTCSCAPNTFTRHWARGGFRIYDFANMDNRDFPEKIVTAPVSPLGQRLYVKTRNATAVGSLAVLRTRIPANEEQPIALMYGFHMSPTPRRAWSSAIGI